VIGALFARPSPPWVRLVPDWADTMRGRTTRSHLRRVSSQVAAKVSGGLLPTSGRGIRCFHDSQFMRRPQHWISFPTSESVYAGLAIRFHGRLPNPDTVTHHDTVLGEFVAFAPVLGIYWDRRTVSGAATTAQEAVNLPRRLFEKESQAEALRSPQLCVTSSLTSFH